jgi:hypothetical protein
MRYLNRRTILPAACLAALLMVASAWPAHAGPGDDATDDDPKKDHTGHHHAHKARHVALFVGGTSVAGYTIFTLGGEAEYRLPIWKQRLGMGALVDATFGDHAHTIVGALMTARPIPGASNVKLMAAPAAMRSHGHSYFLMRTGIAVDFHVQSFSITPLVDLDFVKGGVDTVFGVALGVGF